MFGDHMGVDAAADAEVRRQSGIARLQQVDQVIQDLVRDRLQLLLEAEFDVRGKKVFAIAGLQKAGAKVRRSEGCERGESNPHALSGTGT